MRCSTDHICVPVVSHEGKTAAQIAEELIAGQFVEITDGFPVKDTQQLYDVMMRLLSKEFVRMPVIGISSGQADPIQRVYTMFDHHAQHKALWDKLGSPPEVNFTTAIGQVTVDIPSDGSPYLILPNVNINLIGGDTRFPAYIPLSTGSVFGLDYERGHPLSNRFNNIGKMAMKKVFHIPGIEFEGFQS